MKTSTTNARSAQDLTKIWEDPVKRFECVREERETRIDAWKKEMEALIKSDRNEKIELQRALDDLQIEDENDPEVQKQIKQIKEKLRYLKKKDEILANKPPSEPKKITDADLKKIITSADIENKNAEIFEDIFNENEANRCPFCGMTFDDLAGHLKTSDEDIQKMNDIPKREKEYKDNAANAEELMNDL